jgi:hypothetical protein
MSKVVFNEQQRFNQWWLILIFIGFIAFLLYQLIIDLSSNDFDLTPYIFSFAFLSLMAFLIAKVVLKTTVDNEGIHIQFWPFYIKDKFYPWSDIEEIEVKKYSPILDYGGWGYRFNFRGKGTALNVKGNQGIHLEFKNGKKLLIGTQKAYEVRQIIQLYSRKQY